MSSDLMNQNLITKQVISNASTDSQKSFPQCKSMGKVFLNHIASCDGHRSCKTMLWPLWAWSLHPCYQLKRCTVTSSTPVNDEGLRLDVKSLHLLNIVLSKTPTRDKKHFKIWNVSFYRCKPLTDDAIWRCLVRVVHLNLLLSIKYTTECLHEWGSDFGNR